MMPLAAVGGDVVQTGEATIQVVELFVALIAAAAVVALADPSVGAAVQRRARRARAARRGASGRRPALVITPELVLIVLVPGARLRGGLPARRRRAPADLRRGWRSWPCPASLVSAGVVALVLSAAGLQPSLAFIVGAIVSATDPVSVIATFKTLGAPARLATLVEAESLFNDGTAVVDVPASRSGPRPGPVEPLDAVVGFVATVVMSPVHRARSSASSRRGSWLSPGITSSSSTISVVLAYGTYLVADRLGQSGIIATVVAGHRPRDVRPAGRAAGRRRSRRSTRSGSSSRSS